MTYIPDPIERIEMAIERNLEEADYDPRDGTMLCARCRVRFPAEALSPASPDPCAAAVCDICMMRDAEREKL